jgi:hypothetical protein
LFVEIPYFSIKNTPQKLVGSRNVIFFSSICHADFENVIKNSVSAWTLEGRWYTGQKIRQIWAEWAA